MPQNAEPTGPGDAGVGVPTSLRRILSPAGMRRVAAIAVLTLRDAVRSRVLLGMTALMCLFAAGSLLAPADLDRDRVVFVQRFCYGTLTFFGLIAAAFLGGMSLPKDILSKRIYSIAAKPVSRLELLTGKVAGLVGVMAAFLFFGAVITFAVTHLASARKSYAGGSYTLEVIDPTARVLRDDEKDEAVQVRKGQLLVAEGKTDGRYRVRIDTRDASITGTVPANAVRLHVRTLRPIRVAEPVEAAAFCIGRARVASGELLLECPAELAAKDAWTFSLPSADLPGQGNQVTVRLRFGALRHEPLRGDRSRHEPPRVAFLFRNPQAARPLEVRKEIEFTFAPVETRSVPRRGKRLNMYEEVLALPRELFAGGILEARVLDFTPRYPPRARIIFPQSRQPTWLIRGFRESDLPEGDPTLRARFLVFGSSGMDILDQVTLTAEIQNPATGETKSVPINLRNKTTTYVHFPRRLVDPAAGVRVTLRGLGPNIRIGHNSKESPVHLVLRPDRFWASTARSVLLILFQLTLFTVLASAASTFLSAPVAILLALVMVLSGAVKDMILASRAAAELASPAQALAQGATVAQAAWLWVEYVLRKVLFWLAPGFERFSSGFYINRGWSVPWSAVSNALGYTLVYAGICFGIGYLIFRRREFE